MSDGTQQTHNITKLADILMKVNKKRITEGPVRKERMPVETAPRYRGDDPVFYGESACTATWQVALLSHFAEGLTTDSTVIAAAGFRGHDPALVCVHHIRHIFHYLSLPRQMDHGDCCQTTSG